MRAPRSGTSFRFSVALLVLASCAGSPSLPDDVPPEGDDDGNGVAADPAPFDALPLSSLESEACQPDVAQHEWQYRAHVPRDTAVEYTTNPPSWGVHYATWVEYGSHERPVDRREYVHNLEHGAVVLLYKCDSAEACPSVAEALRRIAETVPPEPFCESWGGGVRARVVVSPDPHLDTPIAAAAWGHTYRSECFDEASLRAFLQARIGQGPEANCADGAGGTAMDPVATP